MVAPKLPITFFSGAGSHCCVAWLAPPLSLNNRQPRTSGQTMVFITCICMPNSSLHCLFLASPKPRPFSSLSVNSAKQEEHPFLLKAKLGFSRPLPVPPNRRRLRSVRFFNSGKESNNNAKLQDDGLDLAIFKRWDVPWQWDDVSLTSLACVVSFLLTGVVERAAIPFLGLKIEELSLDEKAEMLFLDQSITTAVVLGVLYRIINTLQPHPEDIFCYNLREPFNLQKGWLLWAGIGFSCTVLASALTGIAMSIFNSEAQQQETDTLVRLLPLIGSSTIRTACLVGVTGVLAPILEETVFRGFFMVSLTKWVPTPVAVLISSAAFALAHQSPGEFPQLFVLGTALGLSYAHTRNLLTPITIHAFWNSGIILILTFLQLQGYDIKEL